MAVATPEEFIGWLLIAPKVWSIKYTDPPEAVEGKVAVRVIVLLTSALAVNEIIDWLVVLGLTKGTIDKQTVELLAVEQLPDAITTSGIC